MAATTAPAARPCSTARRTSPLSRRSRRPLRSPLTCRAETDNPAALPPEELEAKMKEAMDANPQLKQQMEAMEEAMEQNPALRQQMAQMAELMKRDPAKFQQVVMAQQQQQKEMQEILASDEFKQKVEELKGDADLVPLFKAVEEQGQAGLQQFWDDEAVLRKFGRMMIEVREMRAANGTASAAGAAPAGPAEVNNLFDAAKEGDVEALEDFVAIGKDLNDQDSEGRTPLHYAVAYDKAISVDALIEAGATIDSRDNKQNTPLHYACGYGRVDIAEALLDAGADPAAVQEEFQTPKMLAEKDERNPIAKNSKLIERLAG